MKRRQKIEMVKGQLFIGKKCMKHSYVYFLKTDPGWICKNGYSNKTLFYKGNLQLVEEGNLNIIKETFNKFK